MPWPFSGSLNSIWLHEVGHFWNPLPWLAFCRSRILLHLLDSPTYWISRTLWLHDRRFPALFPKSYDSSFLHKVQAFLAAHNLGRRTLYPSGTWQVCFSFHLNVCFWASSWRSSPNRRYINCKKMFLLHYHCSANLPFLVFYALPVLLFCFSSRSTSTRGPSYSSSLAFHPQRCLCALIEQIVNHQLPALLHSVTTLAPFHRSFDSSRALFCMRSWKLLLWVSRWRLRTAMDSSCKRCS